MRPSDKPGKPTGLWEARATLGYADGKRVRRSFYGQTRQEAAQAMIEAIAKAGQGVVTPSGRLTVDAHVTDWLERLAPRLRPSTALRYRQLLELHAIPELGRMKLTQLQPRHIERAMTAAVAKGLAPRTANHLRAALRAALADAVEKGALVRNPAGGRLVKPLRVDDAGIEPMTPEEARGIIAAVRNTPLEGPVSAALWLGLRQGEVLGLRWRDVEGDFRSLRVAGALDRHQGAWSWSEPKTARSRRTLHIPSPLVAVLRALRGQLAALPLPTDRPGGLPGDLVFVTPTGEPIEGTGLTHRFRDALRHEGLRPRRFHDLRHGTATLLLASGVDIKTVSAILGHSTIAVTANTYASVLPSLHAEAAEKMARLLG
jgi:integrase